MDHDGSSSGLREGVPFNSLHSLAKCPQIQATLINPTSHGEPAFRKDATWYYWWMARCFASYGHISHRSTVFSDMRTVPFNLTHFEGHPSITLHSDTEEEQFLGIRHDMRCRSLWCDPHTVWQYPTYSEHSLNQSMEMGGVMGIQYCRSISSATSRSDACSNLKIYLCLTSGFNNTFQGVQMGV